MENTPSRHHLWFEHRHFRDNLGRKLRNQHGFVIPTNVLWHRELHARVEPPPTPNPLQIHTLLSLIQAVEHVGKFDMLNYTIDAFQDFSQQDNGLEHNALLIATNLQAQLDYLQHGVTHARITV